MKLEPSTLHFDLSDHSSEHEFTLLCGEGGELPLRRYADEPSALERHRDANPALALLQEDQLGQLTHFVEDAPLAQRGVSFGRVVYPSRDEHPLPEIALVFPHVGRSDVEEALARFSTPAPQRPLPLGLRAFDVEIEEALTNLRALHVGASSIKPPAVTAQALVLQHPEIGSTSGAVAQYVLDTYVSGGAAFAELVRYIQENGPGSPDQWYAKSWVRWAANEDGSGPLVPAPANLDLVYRDGQKNTDWPLIPGTDVAGMPSYDLTDEYEGSEARVAAGGRRGGVVEAATPVILEVLRKTKDDGALDGLLWSKQVGTTSLATTQDVDEVAERTVGESGEDSGFAVKNVTSSYGLWIYDTDVDWTEDKKELKVPVKNWPARYLGAYVQFFGADGKVIDRAAIKATNPKDPANPFTWQDLQLMDWMQPSPSKNYLQMVPPGAAVLGAPVPFLTQVAGLTFLWPDDAVRADVLLGGLGAAAGFADWDGDVDVVGVLGTGIVVYGVGVGMMAFSAYVTNPFIKMLHEEWGDVAFFAMCGVIGAPAIVTGIGVFDTRTGKFILAKLGNIAAGVIFGKVAERLINIGAQKAATAIAKASGTFVAELTAAQALQAVPVAGWALKIASISASLAALAATTVECAMSPATYNLQVLRTMDLTVTLTPDPRHGKDGHAPVWPAVGDHWVVEVTYPAAPGAEAGTTHVRSGPMPSRPDEAIVAVLKGLPAGGSIEVRGNIYSGDDWLCGQWASGAMSATPATGKTIEVSGAITEKLAPLTADTAYRQTRTLTYAEGKHAWMQTTFTLEQALAADLDGGGTPSDAVCKAFAQRGNPLPAEATVAVVAKGTTWRITGGGVAFDVVLRKVGQAQAHLGAEGQAVLAVQDTVHERPPAPKVYPLPSGPTGQQLGALQGIVHNDAEYQLGYAWMASGLNLPVTEGDQPQNVPMYAMQSISTLGEPEEQITEPSLGLTLPTFLALDQFGLTELFGVPAALAKELVDGPVRAPVAKAFADAGRELPEGAAVRVNDAATSWDVLVDGAPHYALRLVLDPDAAAGEVGSHVAVYVAPLPRLDNFWLDQRARSTENPVAYLRGVDLHLAPGKYTFDYSSSTAWGRFLLETGSLQALAVHPHGYVVGVDFVNHKLYVLKLPAEAVPNEEAPFAMPLSGEGRLEGLMHNPQALTISSDGRILVLEEGNRRIQAFDVRGNPVPGFSVDQPHFSLATTFVDELDRRETTPALVAAFQAGAAPTTAPKLTVADPAAVVESLDAGTVDPVLTTAFRDGGYAGPDEDFAVSTTKAGSLWLVTATTSQASFDVRLEADELGVPRLSVRIAPVLSITLEARGRTWLVEDTTNSARWRVVARESGDDDLVATGLVSWAPLRHQDTPGITYLDIAAEAKGYIYVLMVKQVSGKDPEFLLDIHHPDGSLLLSQPQSGINAGRLTVDRWRSMFTLGFGEILGPDGRTEPGVSAWVPSVTAAR